MTVRPKFSLPQARALDRLLMMATDQHEWVEDTFSVRRERDSLKRALRIWEEEIRAVEYCARNKLRRRDLRHQGTIQ